MDELDSANLWEMTHCRTKVSESVFYLPKKLPNFGDYTRKYQPAGGHILGPLVLLILSGKNLQSEDAKNLILYFKHYLIAMQLNDDMHDWKEDLRRGHISTAVGMLIQDFIAVNTNAETIHLEQNLQELKKIFWFKTIPKMCKIALLHTKISLKALKSIKSIENSAPLRRLICLSENVATQAKEEHENSVGFLNSFIFSL